MNEIDLKSVVIRGFAEQLAGEGRPDIEDFMTHEHHGSVFDMDEMAYGYFKVMNYEHQDLENWKENALRKIERYREPLPPEFHSLMAPGRTPATVKKIGRNEPCPCGSGKKYKKCHGK